MESIRTDEVRNLTIIVSGVADMPNYNRSFSIIPSRVEIRYEWQHPDHADSSYKPGQARVEVSGPRRLKSGTPGHAWVTVTFGTGYGNVRPDWLIALVAEHTPAGFAA